MIYKRGYAKIEKQRIQLTNNTAVEKFLGKHGIVCIEDLINEIYSVVHILKKRTTFYGHLNSDHQEEGFYVKDILFKEEEIGEIENNSLINWLFKWSD